MADTKIIDRVRKLLALAERAGTPEEAGTAYATAQKLIAQHMLTAEQVRQARVRETGGPVDEPIVRRIVLATKVHHMPTWLAILGGVLADVNGCDLCIGHAFGSAAEALGGKAGGVRTLEAWGRASDLEIVEELLRIIPGQIDAICDQSPFTGRTARNNFRIGAVSTVCGRLREAARTARKSIEAAAAQQDASAPAAVAEVTALALQTLDTRVARASAQMSKDCPRMQARKSSYRSDANARAAGRAAGARVAITRSRAMS